MANRLQTRSQSVAERDDVADASVAHRRRNLAARPTWQRSDLAIAGSLAGLLAPAWLLPEAWWPPLCRALTRIPGLTDRSLLARTADSLRVALEEQDGRRAAALARDLQA